MAERMMIIAAVMMATEKIEITEMMLITLCDFLEKRNLRAIKNLKPMAELFFL
jgi:hypothetical protein